MSSGRPGDDSNDSVLVSSIKNIIAGSARGVTQVIVGHPLDTIKVRLQTQAASGEKKFSGVLDVYRQTVRKEGYRAFFKGATSPLAGCALYSATMFLAYGNACRLYSDVPLPWRIVCVGATTGFCASLVEGPIELTKTKCQVQYHRVGTDAPRYSGALDCARQLVSKYGPRGLYQGWRGMALRNMPGSTVYFGTYDVFRPALVERSALPRSLAILTAGGLSGMCFWIAIYPLDLARTKLMADAEEKALRKFTGPIDAILKTVAVDGVRGLYAGFVPCMMRAAPVNAACFLAYETTRKALG